MKNKVFLILFSIFVIFNKIYSNEIYNILIYPSILIISSLIFNFKKEFPKRKIIIYQVIKIVLIYILIYYSAGFFIDYLKNPYGREFNALIINFFSILLVTSLKEYIRGNLINGVVNKKHFYLFLIWFIFIILELDINLIIESINTFDEFTLIFTSHITPVIVINTFMTYLCTKGGYLPGLIYRSTLTLASLLIPVVPDFNPVITSLFECIFPFFTYLLIRNELQRDDKYEEEIKPSNWIITTSILTLIMLFALGTFNVKPVAVLTGSMKPSINEGDLLIISKCSIETVKPFDIVEFEIRGYSIVHRVIRIENKTLVTKGDNNLFEDKERVTSDNLTGCLKFKIPYLGYPAYMLKVIFNKGEVYI